MKTEQKLYAAIAVVVVLGIVVYLSRKEDQEQLQAHSTAAATSLQKVALSPEQLKKVTKIEIKNKDKGDVVLVKTGDAPADAKDAPDAGDKKKDPNKYGVWKLNKPQEAEVNQTNVNSMLDNLEKIELREVITKTTDLYEKYEVEGDNAVHVVAYQGDEKVFDMWFGKSGGRGQLARVAGTDGVFVAKGYQGYLFTREVKHWRKTDIWKFEDKNAIQVQIENEHGKFSFTKGEEDWAGTFAKRDEGKLSARAEALEEFDAKKLEGMLRAYKTLRATDFAEEGADTGLEDPVKTGGKVTIALKDDAGTFTLKVGKKAKNDDRFAQAEGGDGTTYILSSWTAKWAVAEPKEFQKDADKDDAKDDDEDDDAKDDDAKDDDAKDDDAKDDDAAKPKPKAPAPKPKAPGPKTKPKAPAPKPKGGDTPYD